MVYKAYLLASLKYEDNNLRFSNLGIYSESPNHITWNWGHGVPACIMEMDGTSFAEARQSLLNDLKKHHPKLYRLLALQGLK